MKIFEDARRRALRTFNTNNKTNIPYSAVEFGPPMPYDSVVPVPGQSDSDYGPNTVMSLKMLPGAPYTGETQVYYNRYPLGRGWRHAPLKTLLPIFAKDETTVHALLPEINKRLGCDLAPRDVVDAELDLRLGFMKLELKAAPTSYEWIGSVELAIWKRDRGDEFDFVNIGKLWGADDLAQQSVSGYPVTGKWAVSSATYHVDYSPSYAALKALPSAVAWTPISDANATALANALKAVDTRPWVMSTAIVNWNLRASSIYYNGKVKDFVPIGTLVDDPGLASIVDILNKDYDNVIIVRPDWPWKSASGFRSFIIAHYNDPL